MGGVSCRPSGFGGERAGPILLRPTTPARAAPMLSVDSSTDGQSTFTYVVTNQTTPSEPQHGVGYLIFPFGRDAGVVEASSTGWAAIIQDDTRASRTSLSACPPGTSRTFTLGSTYTDTTTGLMTAAVNGGFQYPAVPVTAPAAALLARILTALRRRRAS